MVKVSMPLYLRLSITGKQYWINLNNYHNWHYQVRNKLKIEYQRVFLSMLRPPIPFFLECSIEFILYPGDKRKRDRSNVLSIHEKFACDALSGICYKDDNDDHVKSTTYRTGDIDRISPRVEIIIKGIRKQEFIF